MSSRKVQAADSLLIDADSMVILNLLSAVCSDQVIIMSAYMCSDFSWLCFFSLGLLSDAISRDEGTRRSCWIWISLSVCLRIWYGFFFSPSRVYNSTKQEHDVESFCFFRHQVVQYPETGAIWPSFSTFSRFLGYLLFCLLARQGVNRWLHQHI